MNGEEKESWLCNYLEKKLMEIELTKDTFPYSEKHFVVGIALLYRINKISADFYLEKYRITTNRKLERLLHEDQY